MNRLRNLLPAITIAILSACNHGAQPLPAQQPVKATTWKCAFCAVCVRITVWLCELTACREAHEVSAEGCARTRKEARV